MHTTQLCLVVFAASSVNSSQLLEKPETPVAVNITSSGLLSLDIISTGPNSGNIGDPFTGAFMSFITVTEVGLGFVVKQIRHSQYLDPEFHGASMKS
jgi:hypothetical protein